MADIIARGLAASLRSRVSNLESAAGLSSLTSYGIRYTISTDTITRLGNSVGKVANANGGANDFNNILPWAGMRRCNLDDNLNVNAYYGDATYIEDGSNGQCMVEVPAFYYKRAFVNTDTIDTYISMFPLEGFKLHPWFYDANGMPVNKKYISTYEGCIFDVTASATEVNTVTVTAPCTTSGNLTITLDNFNTFTVPVLDTDNTNDLVATKIRSATYTGWTTSGTEANVIFTSNVPGAKTTAIFSGGTTGVTATVVKTTTGAGGYVGLDAQVADFTATTGDKLASVAGVKPASGKTQDLTIAKSRIIASNRGTKWQQLYFSATSAIQILFAVEYASFNSQSKIGQGVVNISDTPNTENNSMLTGATASLGNLSGKASGTDGLVSVSYRGIENFWGNIWSWVDGFNVNNNIAYISRVNGSFASDTFSGNYEQKATIANANGYFSKSALGYNFDYGYIPIEVTGTSTSKYADYYFQNSVGAFVAILGGRWDIGANAGAFYWSLTYGSAVRSRIVGARLCV
jgi:hypothetical protein